MTDHPIQSALVLVNPISGQGKGGRSTDELAAAFRRYGVEAQVILLPGPKTAGDIIREKAGQHQCVVAVGGDGTISETAEGVFRHHPALPIGIVPWGLSNCLARQMGIGGDTASTARTIAEGRTRPRDIVLIKERVALSFVGAGFDAQVVDRVARRRRGPVMKSDYTRAALSVLFSKRWPRLSIEIDGQPVPGSYFQILLGLIDNYAHYFKMPPNGVYARGVRAFLFEGRKPIHLMRTALRLGPGIDLSRAADNMVMVQNEITITSEMADGYYQFDGEAGGPLPVICRVVPEALTFIGPGPGPENG